MNLFILHTWFKLWFIVKYVPELGQIIPKHNVFASDAHRERMLLYIETTSDPCYLNGAPSDQHQ